MLEGIKKDFPVLNQIVNDEPLVYLDVYKRQLVKLLLKVKQTLVATL